MQKILLTLLTVLVAFSFIMTDAQAKRMGGGKSMGVRHETSSFSTSKSATASKMAPAATTAAKPASGASRWLGPLAGLAIGGLLASLFMQNGVMSGVMSWILLAAGIFLLWRVIGFFLSRRMVAPATQPMRFQAEPANYNPATSFPFQNNTSSMVDAASVEEDARLKNFDEATFLRQAKTVFIRLQAANDTKNLSDIRQFTSPEMFAEIQMQMQERGDAVNFTQVLTIDAQLVNLTTDQNGIIASVSFSGLIREEQNTAPIDLKEIWNFYNDDASQKWLVVGIQQPEVNNVTQ